MGVLIQNEQVVGGLDAAVAAKIGTATLTTSASDLSGAVNELDADISTINNNLVYYKDYTVTMSSSAWRGVYYADVNISTEINAGYTAISIIPIDVNSNRPCYAYLFNNGTAGRIATTSTDIGGTTAKVRVGFTKNSSLS